MKYGQQFRVIHFEIPHEPRQQSFHSCFSPAKSNTLSLPRQEIKASKCPPFVRERGREANKNIRQLCVSPETPRACPHVPRARKMRKRQFESLASWYTNAGSVQLFLQRPTGVQNRPVLEVFSATQSR